MTEIVDNLKFVRALEEGHGMWLFTAIGPLSSQLRDALELNAHDIDLIISIETASKNLQNHPELIDIHHHFEVAVAGMRTDVFEIISSGARSIRVFYQFKTEMWELVIKRSKTNEAICTSLHRANDKRLKSARKRGQQFGTSRLADD
jgi:ribosome-interacting GTPase 1